MKNPVIPYAIIAVLGVLAVIIISYVGADQRQAIQNEEEGGTEQTQEGEVAGDPDAVYQANCMSCHGADLSGGMGPDLTTIGAELSADEITGIIQNGQGSMPPISALSVEEAGMLADWLSEKQ